MWISDKWQDFELIDCSRGEKLERWGRYFLVRPDPQAIWDTPRRNMHWNDRDARYRRSESGGGSWDKGGLPENWKIKYGELTFNVKPMNFKHTGLFPEQACNWDWAMAKIRAAGRPISVLNRSKKRYQTGNVRTIHHYIRNCIDFTFVSKLHTQRKEKEITFSTYILGGK